MTNIHYNLHADEATVSNAFNQTFLICSFGGRVIWFNSTLCLDFDRNFQIQNWAWLRYRDNVIKYIPKYMKSYLL